MLVNFLEQVSKVDNLSLPHKGIVVDNIDPKKLGRLKCIVKGLFEGDDKDMLPWCFPRNSYGLGGGGDSTPYNSGFSVPEIGTELEIQFPYKDIYHPMYVGFWQSEITHQVGFDSNYPECYGFRDSSGSYIKVDKDEGYMKFKHGPSGSYFDLDKDGNLTVFISGNMRVHIAKDIVISAEGMGKLNTVKNLKFDGSRIDHNLDHETTPNPPEPDRAIE
jgi:hypothetical protein